MYKIMSKETHKFLTYNGAITKHRYTVPTWSRFGHVWHKKTDASLYLSHLNDIRIELRSRGLLLESLRLESILVQCGIVKLEVGVSEIIEWSVEEPNLNHLIIEEGVVPTKKEGRGDPHICP